MTKNNQIDTNNHINNTKENKSSLSLFFWLGVGVLFLISFVMAFKFGFLAIVIILIIWVIFIFVIRKFSFSLLISIFILAGVFILSIFYLVFFNNNQDNHKASSVATSESSNDKVKKDMPILEMTIIKSPKVINCDDEKSIIEIQAKNIGQKDFAFDEIKNHQYDFEICDGDKENKNGGRSCFPSIAGYLAVEDFGKIKKGETKIIKLTTPTKNKPDNAIASFLEKTKINGVYKYYISFIKIESPKKKPLISKSNIFTVKTNIMNSANEYIKIKCRKNNN